MELQAMVLPVSEAKSSKWLWNSLLVTPDAERYIWGTFWL
jgi:hypothetical protein